MLFGRGSVSHYCRVLAIIVLCCFSAFAHALIYDNLDAEFSTVGTWPTSTKQAGYYGANYAYSPAGVGNQTATWNISIGADGQYTIDAHWTTDTTRATNAPYTIYNNDVFIATVLVDQKINGGVFNRLGEYTLQAGTLSIVLSDNANGHVSADAVQVDYLAPPLDNPVPTISAIDPNTISEGGPDFQLTVTGTNFVNGSVVRWNGSDRITSYVSSTQLTATMLAVDISVADTSTLTVFNPLPGGGESASLTFTVVVGNLPPDGLINSPAGPVSILTGDSIGFMGSGTDPDNHLPLTYLWNFGAGSGILDSILQNPVAQFNSEGVFTVTLTVTDALGLSDPSPADVIVTVNTPLTTQIIDNLDAEFSTVGTWPTSTKQAGYYGANYAYSPAGVGNQTAAWGISIGAGGQYTIDAQWTTDTTRATNAPYAIYTNDVLIATVLVDQKVNGGIFNRLDEYTLQAGTLSIVLSDDANGHVSADAVQVSYLGPTINNPVPVISAIEPDTTTESGTDFILTVTGTDFINGSVVRWNGSDRATTYMSPTQVTATILAADIATPTTAIVTVFNPLPGGGESSGINFTVTSVTNSAPIANAGIDQTVNENTVVNLDGSGSSDADGTIASYAWSQTVGPVVTLTGGTTATPSFTVPDVGVDTIFTFQLTVTDNEGASTVDNVTVTVLVVQNLSPNGLINSPADSVSILTGDSIGFMGSGTDPDNHLPLTYLWNFGAGSGILDSILQNPVAQFNSEGVFTVTLTVTDALGLSDPSPADVIVTVNTPLTTQIIDNLDAEFSTVGTWPTSTKQAGYYGANYAYSPAGVGNQTAAWGISIGAGGQYTIDAQWTTDTTRATNAPYAIYTNDVLIATVLVDQKVNGGIFNRLDEYTLQAGTLSIVLSDDANGHVSADAVQVSYLGPTINNPVPVISAIEPDTTTESGTDFILTVTGTDFINGSVVRWNGSDRATTYMSPTQVTATILAADIATPTTAIVTVFNPLPGGGESSGINFTVTSVTNSAPIANAGIDQTVNENTVVNLDGSGSSDADGTIASYAWSQTVGPVVILTGGTTATPNFTAPEVSTDTVLTFQLTVTDNDGTTHSDLIDITVQNINQAPVANAGVDQTVNENTVVNLDGSGSSDADGAIASYAWVQTAGSTTVSLSDLSVANPSFTAPDVGVDTIFTNKYVNYAT